MKKIVGMVLFAIHFFSLQIIASSKAKYQNRNKYQYHDGYCYRDVDYITPKKECVLYSQYFEGGTAPIIYNVSSRNNDAIFDTYAPKTQKTVLQQSSKVSSSKNKRQQSRIVNKKNHV